MNQSQLFHGDCLTVLPQIGSRTVDLVVTSPPYNVGVEYDQGDGLDFRSVEAYHKFAIRVMQEVQRVLVSGGRACIEIGGSGRNLPLSYIWQDAAFKTGMGLYSEIVMQHRKTNQCAWGSWLKADNVNTIPNFHSLYVFWKDSETKTGRGPTTISAEEFSEWTRGMWTIRWSDGNKAHPASFPEEFPARCMKLFGHAGDMVLDPMMGSGTTGVVASKLGRDFIGIESGENYFNYARRRIDFERGQTSIFEVENDTNESISEPSA